MLVRSTYIKKYKLQTLYIYFFFRLKRNLQNYFTIILVQLYRININTSEMHPEINI